MKMTFSDKVCALVWLQLRHPQRRPKAPDVGCKSVRLWRRRRRDWCLFTNRSTAGHSRLSVRTQRRMWDGWSGNCIFHPVPLCLCSPYTHYTTGNTCNASRRDFWQRGGGNNFRTPAPLLFLPPPPRSNSPARRSYVSHRSGGWRQLISSPWHAMMERRALNPSTYSRPPRSSTPPSERQCVGRLASLLIGHGWTAREALTPFSSGGFLHFCGPRHAATEPVTMFHADCVTLLRIKLPHIRRLISAQLQTKPCISLYQLILDFSQLNCQ